MINLNQDDYSKMPDEIISDIEFYKQSHTDEINKIRKSKYTESAMSLDEFCETFKNEIEADIIKKENHLTSIETTVRNAIRHGTSKQAVDQMDKAEQSIRDSRGNYTSALNQ